MATDRHEHLTELADALIKAVNRQEIDRIAVAMSGDNYDELRRTALRLENAMNDIMTVGCILRRAADESEP